MDDLRFLDPEALVNRAAFNERFGLLNAAALYKTVTPTAQLGTLAEGTIIYLNENGSPVPFYVAKQGYEPSYNTDRVLVVRKDVYSNRVWDAGNVNAYAGSDIDNWLNGTYKNLLDTDVQAAIGTTEFPYTPGNGNNTVSTLARSIFALSLTELGESNSSANVEGSALPIASMLWIAYRNGSPTTQWTRSPATHSTDVAWRVGSNGNIDYYGCLNSGGSRPAFTLPSTFTAYTSEPTTGLYDLSNNLLLTLPGVQIATGSYVGTGTYGVDNPTSLTFSFEPKVLFISPVTTDVSAVNYQSIFWKGVIGFPTYTSDAAIGMSIVSNWGPTVSWYTTGSYANRQLNDAGMTYDYIALG